VLASVLWLVQERIDRHHARPHRAVIKEWA
jgi:hypothetical protein